MSDNHREIAMNLARQFVVIAENYLPDVILAAQTTEKSISFGCTVIFKPRKGSPLIHAELRAKPPKIPRPGMEVLSLTLQLDTSEQLELLFVGKPEELLAEVSRQEDEAKPEDDGYVPADNSVEA